MAMPSPVPKRAQRFDARNVRIGRIGYTFDYDSIDANFLDGENAFDAVALRQIASENLDPNDDGYMATQGPIFASDLATENPDAPDPGLTRLGNPTGGRQRLDETAKTFDTVGDPDNRAVEVLQFIPRRAFPPPGSLIEDRVIALAQGVAINATGDPNARDLIEDIEDVEAVIADLNGLNEVTIANPVDNVLRGFRAFHPLNWVGIAENFGLVDFTTEPPQNEGGDNNRNDVNNVILNGFQNNPFGRARASGCTACHVRYASDGNNREPIDRTVADNGRQATTDLPYGMRVDLGQRFWAEKHEIKRDVPIETCNVCHAFVTRVDFGYTGKWENEEDDVLAGDINRAFLGLQKLGPFTFETPNGTQVNVFDNVAVWQNGVLKNAGEGLSEDINNNGELDTDLDEVDIDGDGVVDPNEDFNGNGEFDTGLNEDVNGNGLLDIPDRVTRSGAADGRQQKFIYGGANGAMLMKDVHFEAGMDCVDCHGIQDVHGDGNIYTRNWDQIQIECDDCHGTSYSIANLITSGPNGGQDLTTETIAFVNPVNPAVKKALVRARRRRHDHSELAHRSRSVLGRPAAHRRR